MHSSFSFWGCFVCIHVQCMYCSLMKECPPSKKRPHPTFGPISCIGSKFTQMSAYPWASFAWLMEWYSWSLRSTATSAMHICSNKKLHWRLLQGINAACIASSRWHSAVQDVVCHQGSLLCVSLSLFEGFLSTTCMYMYLATKSLISFVAVVPVLVSWTRSSWTLHVHYISVSSQDKAVTKWWLQM